MSTLTSAAGIPPCCLPDTAAHVLPAPSAGRTSVTAHDECEPSARSSPRAVPRRPDPLLPATAVSLKAGVR